VKLRTQYRLVIGILLVSAFVVMLNETVMSVALPVIMTDLRIEASVGQWLTSGFMLTTAVIIPITGFLIRRVPTRPLFATAMVLFSTGTLLAAVAPDFGVLLTGRIVQASGSAIMLPLLMTTVMTLVPSTRRGAVMGNLSIVMAAAPAIGPAVSGIVLDLLGWRYVFWLVLPAALATLAAGLRLITDIGESSSASIDVASVALSVLGFGGLVYFLSSIGGASDSTSPATVWGALVSGLIGLTAFVIRQRVLQRSDRALLDLRTFRSPTFVAASVTMMATKAALLGTMIVLPIYLQSVLAVEPLDTGLALLPGGVLMALLGPAVGRWCDRFGARALLVPGTLVTSAAMWSALWLAGDSSLLQVVGFHLLLALGLAFVFTPLLSAGLGAVEPKLYSYGSAILGTAQQLAGAAGVALLVSVLSVRASALAAEGAPLVEQTAGGIHMAFLMAAIVSSVAVVGAFFVRDPSEQGIPSPMFPTTRTSEGATG
jgi:DHA2 family lincomycin resistance protein-like MFS transporter